MGERSDGGLDATAAEAGVGSLRVLLAGLLYVAALAVLVVGTAAVLVPFGGQVATAFLPIGSAGWLAVVGLTVLAGFVAVGRSFYRSVRAEYRELLCRTRAVDDDSAAERAARGVVERHARQVGVPAPELRVRVEDDRPVCYTQRNDLGVDVDQEYDPAYEIQVGDLEDGDGGDADSTGDADPEVYVVVTSALLETLDEDELSAVLAHELAHVANGDLRLMTVFLLPEMWADQLLHYARVATPDPEFADSSSGSSGSSGWDDDSLGGPRTAGSRVGGRALLNALRILFALLAGVVGVVVRLLGLASLAVFGRGREYAADRGAVALTGDPAALGSAVETLAADETPAPEHDYRAVAAVDVVPSADEGLLGRSGLTHPPVEARLRRIREQAE